jgi:molecular chaperone HtpG
MTATANVETHTFEAETTRLLDLMIHSLYTNKEIFLRELLSNASDALDKIHFESLTNPDLLGDDKELRIRIDTDSSNRTVSISDNGIGMTRAEVVENIGTIAKSGTRELLEQLRESGEADQPSDFIGQFGVGFYSSFMVSDRVTLETRRAGEEAGIRWESEGDGQYTLTEIDKPERGTTVTLYLKAIDTEGGIEDYTLPFRIAQIVRAHSDFVAYPILQEQSREEVERDKEGNVVEGGKKETITELVTLNSMQPIWTRPRTEVTEEEYAEFYRHVSHDWQPPASTYHLKAEGRLEYTTLLYLPSHAPADLFYPNQQYGLQLYVRRVLILEQYEELLPRHLRFVKGIVDSADLPLNISRQRLQEDRHINQIRQWVAGRLLDNFKKMQKEEPEAYLKFWMNFGPVLKEGLADPAAKEGLLPLLMFASSNDPEKPTTLAEYVSRMQEGQAEIYYITGATREIVENAPQTEQLKAAGYEVLYLVDSIDEFMAQFLDKFEEKTMRDASRGAIEVGDEEERKHAEEALKKESENYEGLLKSLNSELEEYVKEVRFTSRLTDSPACLVGGEFDLSPQLARMLAQSGSDVPEQKRILELNPKHPIVSKLESLQGEDAFGDQVFLLYGNALLSEGGEIPDPARFQRLLTDLMLK